MKLLFSTVLVFLSVLLAFGEASSTVSALRRTLKQLLWESKDLLKLCVSKNDTQWDCLRRESLAIVDNFARSERIPLFAGTSLVRVQNVAENNQENDVEMTLNTDGNETSSVGVKQSRNKAIPSESWQDHVLNALDTMLETHVLQVDLLQDGTGEKRRIKAKKHLWFWQQDEKSAVEGRHRRHRHQMIPMMIFGVTVFGMFVIPIGFQFLAALSGKAFLMAKLALLLASINGLKRVASPGVHYGLYHTVDPHHLPHSPALFYDRESTFGPRNLPPTE
ncbi:uncharacterized protein LOC129718387 isoform X2 [Wyeomyia smithii]|uniref:uncharacterized protein LOC129718387 isoform X2 n=1 Tax=Wyeomyia smithii TaxID=174621 RepID=UPI00246810E8|nr:uncharacterized protein LOC129718387 isoform X2 [Wyeomyia smithii]